MRRAFVEINLEDKKVERVIYGNDNKSMTDLAILNPDIQNFSETVNKRLKSADCADKRRLSGAGQVKENGKMRS